MHYVYLLNSESHPRQPYWGSTGDSRQRLKDHNEGRSLTTYGQVSSMDPRRLFCICAETDRHRVREVPEVQFRTSIHETALSLIEAGGPKAVGVASAKADRPKTAKLRLAGQYQACLQNRLVPHACGDKISHYENRLPLSVRARCRAPLPRIARSSDK